MKQLKWEALLQQFDSALVQECYQFFAESTEMEDRTEELFDELRLKLEAYGIDEALISDLSFSFFRIWHLDNEILNAKRMLGELRGRVPF